MYTAGILALLTTVYVSGTVTKQNKGSQVRLARTKRCVCPQVQSYCACPTLVQSSCSCSQYQNPCECPQYTVAYPTATSTVATTTFTTPITTMVTSAAAPRCCYPYSGTVNLCFNVGYCKSKIQQPFAYSASSGTSRTPSIYQYPSESSPAYQYASESATPIYQYPSSRTVVYEYSTQPPVYQSQASPVNQYTPQSPEYEAEMSPVDQYSPQMQPCQNVGSHCYCSSGYFPCSNGSQCCKR